jgi:hypothetical protein
VSEERDVSERLARSRRAMSRLVESVGWVVPVAWLLAATLAVTLGCDGGAGAVSRSDAPFDDTSDAATDLVADTPSDGASDFAADPSGEAGDAVDSTPDTGDALDASSDGEPAPDAAPACEPGTVPVVASPALLWDGDVEALLARVERPPFEALWAEVQARAHTSPSDELTAPALNRRGTIAKAAALVGLVEGDPALLEKARALVASLPQTMRGVLVRGPDDDIDVADALVGHAVALHLLQSADVATEEAEAALVGLTAAFFEYFSFHDLFWGFLPNNHTTKSAAALGLVALVVPGAPDASLWLRYAAAQLAYLWQEWLFSADGAYAEGPGYNSYASITTLPFVVALDRALGGADGLCGLALCQFRRYDRGCVEGAEWAPNLLDLPAFRANLDWTASFVRPDGTLPPYDDSNPTGYPAGVIAGPAGHAELAWMYERWPQTGSPAATGVETLLGWDDELVPVAPTALEVWLPEAGTAVRRTGFGADDRYVFLLAEPSAMQRAGHEHADGLALTVFARGRPRLIDTGYSQYSDRDHVNRAPQHNTVFIDDIGAPLPVLLADDNLPAELVRRDEHAWVAQMRLPGGLVTRTVRFVDDETLEVTDHAVFEEAGSHVLSARWHGLGGLTPEEDDRGVFEPTEHGGRWTTEGVVTLVEAPGATALHELRYDGLLHGVLRQHRCVVLSVTGETQATLTTHLWIGDEGGEPTF